MIARQDDVGARSLTDRSTRTWSPARCPSQRRLLPLPANAARLVVEDSAHLYDTTLASLRGFARFVQPGGFLVVEDGCLNVDDLGPLGNEPWGVLPAIHDRLVSPDGSDFMARGDLELYGISSNPNGILQRRPGL